MAKMTKNFDSDEFLCPCCREEHMDRDFIGRLQRAREHAGIPFTINSGWRCKNWNARVGGTAGSSHVKGLAADIRAPAGRPRFLILDALREAGFKRFGIARDFIHVDADDAKTQQVIWMY